MIVMKYGGSSVGSAEMIKEVFEIIKARIDKRPVVVVSAVSGITDLLIKCAELAEGKDDFMECYQEILDKHREVTKGLGVEMSLITELLEEFKKDIEAIAQEGEASLKMMDRVQSYGERMSSRIIAAYLDKNGIKSRQHDAWDIGMMTSSDYGNAEPTKEAYTEIRKSLADIDYVPVITGFMGKDTNGNITTLGRGGSDYTAAIIGAAIDAEEIQIWTDVDGIMTTDPRVVKDAKVIREISFNEAAELAYFGAKVLHPKTILPAVDKNIPVRVVNTFNPESEGTLIVKESASGGAIRGIAFRKGVRIVNIISTRMLGAHGFLARVFDVFEDYRKSVEMVATSEVSISLTVKDDNNLDKIVRELEDIAEVRVKENKATICLVGEQMRGTVGMAARIFGVLGKGRVNIDMISQGASEINVGFVINEKDLERAVKALHEEFFS